MTHDIRIFDPRDEFQREEILSGRWTIKPDELRQLFAAVGEEGDVSEDEVADIERSLEEKTEELEEFKSKILAALEDGPEDESADDLCEKLIELCDAA